MSGKRIVLIAFIILCSCADFSQAEASDLHLPIEIMIDVGHGGVDSGTTYGNIYEKDINLQIAKALYKQLYEHGYDVLINRTGDYALSEENRWLRSRSRHKRDLAQRKHLAMTVHPQVLISLHVNWSKNPKMSGPLVFYQQNHQSYLLSHLIQQELNQYYRSNESPKKGKTYYILNQSICPTVIVEMGYLSNARDRARLQNPKEQQKIAKAISAGVREYLLLTGALQPSSD